MRSVRSRVLWIGVGAYVSLMALTVTVPPVRPLHAAALQAKKTVWDGVFTAAQVTRGRDAYQKECGACHSDNLQGGDEAPGLVGGGFLSQWVELSVGDFFERVRTTMPQDRPSQLSRSTYADIVAYIFKVNGFPEGPTDLPTDLGTLKAVMIVAKP
jgi:mono/diheme cytochrome c family protein